MSIIDICQRHMLKNWKNVVVVLTRSLEINSFIIYHFFCDYHYNTTLSNFGVCV